MLEREIEKKLTAEVKKLGGVSYKFISPGNDGVPDRVIFLPGASPFFLELKTETGRLSPMQKVQLKRIIGAGDSDELCGVAYGLRGVGMFLDALGYSAPLEKWDKQYGGDRSYAGGCFVYGAQLSEILH